MASESNRLLQSFSPKFKNIKIKYLIKFSTWRNRDTSRYPRRFVPVAGSIDRSRSNPPQLVQWTRTQPTSCPNEWVMKKKIAGFFSCSVWRLTGKLSMLSWGCCTPWWRKRTGSGLRCREMAEKRVGSRSTSLYLPCKRNHLEKSAKLKEIFSKQ